MAAARPTGATSAASDLGQRSVTAFDNHEFATTRRIASMRASPLTEPSRYVRPVRFHFVRSCSGGLDPASNSATEAITEAASESCAINSGTAVVAGADPCLGAGGCEAPADHLVTTIDCAGACVVNDYGSGATAFAFTQTQQLPSTKPSSSSSPSSSSTAPLSQPRRHELICNGNIINSCMSRDNSTPSHLSRRELIWDGVEPTDSVAILLYHKERDAFLLARQFRPPVLYAAWRRTRQRHNGDQVERGHVVQGQNTEAPPEAAPAPLLPLPQMPAGEGGRVPTAATVTNPSPSPQPAPSLTSLASGTGGGWTYELCGGLVDKPGLTSEEVAAAEVEEELGYRVNPGSLT